MDSFIRSSRRDLRLPIRLEAQFAVDRVGYLGHTEDVGAGGCRLLAPRRLATGTRLRLLVLGSGPTELLVVGGTVVWRRDEPAWRHGVVFDEDGGGALAWFEQVAWGHPDLLDLDRVPDQVGLEVRLHVARPPRRRLSAEEAAVLRMACDRATVADLRAALGHCWSRAQRALYALLNCGVVALEPVRPGPRQAC